MVASKNNNTREMETNSFHLNFPLKSLHTIRPNILKIDILNFLFCITPSAVVPPPYLLGQPWLRRRLQNDKACGECLANQNIEHILTGYFDWLIFFHV